jgi:alpha-galactosidase
MRAPHIVLIGAGSALFGPETLRDIFLCEALHGSRITLVDVDEEHLARVHAFGQALNQAAGAGCQVLATTDRRQALPGADFVVVSVAVERERLWKLDWEIPLKHGVRHVLGENGGPGGLSHSLRNIPLLLGICRDIEALAPDAWLLNYTNPMSRVCMAVARHTRLKFVGMCHQIGAGYEIASTILDVPQTELRIRAAGLNHFTWITDLRFTDGRDAYPAFRERLAASDPDFMPLSRRLHDVFGLYPAVGDRHAGEYIGDAWREVGMSGYEFDMYENWVAGVWESIGAVLDGDEDEAAVWLGETSGERGVPIIVALWTNANQYEDAVNVVNNGAIANLPAQAVVEVPAVVGGGGIQPLRVGGLPAGVAALCDRQVTIQELVVEAAVTGNRRAALQALCLDPVIPDTPTAQAILDELLIVHAPYLPQFS